MTVFVGTSGWSYPHWHGPFYPPQTPAGDRLAQYVAVFDSAELNASFYRWPRDRTFARWRRQLPEGFRLAVKASRGLTHAKRLSQPEAWAERIRTSLHELGARRGPLLLQLPASQARDDARLEHFLATLPTWLDVAVELRHPSWLDDETFALLERHGTAYCVMSGARLPCVLRATAPFVYVRLHGPDHDHLYGGSYSDADLRWWAERIAEWHSSGHDVYAYFNNDGEGHAVRNAATLKAWCSHLS